MLLPALAHPAHLLIVEKLARDERCESEPACIVSGDTPAGPHHSSLLSHCGVVEGWWRGSQLAYRLYVSPPLPTAGQRPATNLLHGTGHSMERCAQ